MNSIHLHAGWSLTDIAVGLPAGTCLNQLSDRGAMGLPDADIGPDLKQLRTALAEFIAVLPETAARRAEDPEASFWQRYAAGLALGLVGDARVPPLNPPMVDVPAGRYAIGLSEAAVEPVVAEFACYGVRREWILKECPNHEIDIGHFRIGALPGNDL